MTEPWSNRGTINCPPLLLERQCKQISHKSKLSEPHDFSSYGENVNNDGLLMIYIQRFYYKNLPALLYASTLSKNITLPKKEIFYVILIFYWKKNRILCLVHKYLQPNSSPLFLWQYCFVSHDLIYSFEFLAVPKVHSVLSRPHYPHSSLLWGQPPHLHDWLLSSSITKMNTTFLYKKKEEPFS